MNNDSSYTRNLIETFDTNIDNLLDFPKRLALCIYINHEIIIDGGIQMNMQMQLKK